jgi:hypothetical protein
LPNSKRGGEGTGRAATHRPLLTPAAARAGAGLHPAQWVRVLVRRTRRLIRTAVADVTGGPSASVRPARRPSSLSHRCAVPVSSRSRHYSRSKSGPDWERHPPRACESPLPSNVVRAQRAEPGQGGEQVLWAASENLLDALKTLSLLIISRWSGGYKA